MKFSYFVMIKMLLCFSVFEFFVVRFEFLFLFWFVGILICIVSIKIGDCSYGKIDDYLWGEYKVLIFYNFKGIEFNFVYFGMENVKCGDCILLL